MREAPLHRDALALCGVLLQELEQAPAHEHLALRLAEGVLRLVDAVTLALHESDPYGPLTGADAELATLRAHLLLALELGVIDEDSYLDLSEQADRVGRQIGGWLRKLRG